MLQDCFSAKGTGQIDHVEGLMGGAMICKTSEGAQLSILQTEH